MTNKKQKLELTWIGKDKEVNLEPRILVEVPEKSYGDKDTENMLIHGDNLLALKALEQDYSGKIKCIYIDPPYNTGSAFEHYDDNVEHSVWLNLMKQRLEILHTLLTDDGVIFISIDDREMAYLQVLMDEIFGRLNFIANLPTIMNLKGNQDQFGFAGTHEYTLVYAKNKNLTVLNKFVITSDEDLEQWSEDSIGCYKKGANLVATGINAPREKRPNLFYPILLKDNSLSFPMSQEISRLYDKESKLFDDMYLNFLQQKYTSLGYKVLLPISNQQYMSWRWQISTMNEKKDSDVIIISNKENVSLYKKQRPELGDLPTEKPKSVFYKPEYSSGNGTAQIKALFGYKAFNYPKPEDLIKDFIQIGSNENDIVLDSFIGSGTSVAVAHKMGRKWIGIELGEHCYTLCEPRLHKVVDGTDQGGISKAVNWQGGGGYKFYELAPSLLKKDEFDNWIIEPKYNAEMLAEAMAKHEGYKFSPNETNAYKQGFSTENDFIFTTTQFLSVELLDKIASMLNDGESLLICATHFEDGLGLKYPNITLKKIPQMLLDRCEFGSVNYNLNIVEEPEIEEEE